VTRDPAATIRELKEQSGKNIWLWGSLKLMHSLLAVGVVDEITLLVCPASRGKGTRIFEDWQDLKLVEATSFENGVVTFALREQEIGGKSALPLPATGYRLPATGYRPSSEPTKVRRGRRRTAPAAPSRNWSDSGTSVSAPRVRGVFDHVIDAAQRSASGVRAACAPPGLVVPPSGCSWSSARVGEDGSHACLPPHRPALARLAY